MSAKHTPGPWKWDESWGAIVVERPDNNGKLICPMWTGCDRRGLGRDVIEEDQANARLIAAAPELLAACRDVLPDLELFVSKHGPGPDRRLAALRAAIRKAEGA